MSSTLAGVCQPLLRPQPVLRVRSQPPGPRSERGSVLLWLHFGLRQTPHRQAPLVLGCVDTSGSLPRRIEAFIRLLPPRADAACRAARPSTLPLQPAAAGRNDPMLDECLDHGRQTGRRTRDDRPLCSKKLWKTLLFGQLPLMEAGGPGATAGNEAPPVVRHQVAASGG